MTSRGNLIRLLFFIFPVILTAVSQTNAQASQPPPSQVTVFGLEADEALFLTQTAKPFAVTEVALDGVVQVFGVDVTDGFVDHGTFNALWQESSNGVYFSATGGNFAEIMNCTVDQAQKEAICTFSNSVGGQGTFTGVFTPTDILALATLTPGFATTVLAAQQTSQASSSTQVVVPTLTTSVTQTPATTGPSASVLGGSTTSATPGSSGTRNSPGLLVALSVCGVSGILALLGILSL